MPYKILTWRSVAGLLTALLLWTSTWPAVAAKEQVLRTDANVMVELTLRANRSYADPFNDVILDVTFIDPHGRELRVPGFWAGADAVSYTHLRAHETDSYLV